MKKKLKIAKDSMLRDSMFWYIAIITVFYFGAIMWGIARG